MCPYAKGTERQSLRTGTDSVRKNGLTCRFLTRFSAPTLGVMDVALTIFLGGLTHEYYLAA